MAKKTKFARKVDATSRIWMLTCEDGLKASRDTSHQKHTGMGLRPSQHFPFVVSTIGQVKYGAFGKQTLKNMEKNN
ncbi:MAG: hypothetical protein CM15mV104_070 [Caudoviricetes sp.]|nr:MAG: hypothetical protein CM15mV104_070 [Caudoviricetes sp.]